MNPDDPGAAVFAHIVRALLGRGIQSLESPGLPVDFVFSEGRT